MEIASQAEPEKPLQQETKHAESFEMMVGGKWLNLVAAAALIIAAGWFMKYSIDNGWINEIGRIILGIVAGLFTIYLGDKFQKKSLPVFAQSLSGAGIAILYFTTYAAYNFYHLIPMLAAFAFLIVITALAIALSVYYNAVSISVLGILSGFLTPAIIGGGSGSNEGNNISLMLYIAVLDLAVLGVTRFKEWRGLNILSFIGSVIVVLVYSLSYSNTDTFLILTFTMFYLIFAAQAHVHNVTMERPINFADGFLAAAAPALYFIGCWAILDDNFKYTPAALSIALVVIYLVYSNWIISRTKSSKALCTLYLSFAVAFLTVAVPFTVKGYWVAWGWAIEALIYMYIGLQLNSYKTRIISFWIMVLSVITTFLISTENSSNYYFEAPNRIQPFLNIRFATYLLSSLVIWALARLYKSSKDKINKLETEKLREIYIIAASVILLMGLTIEIALFAQSNHYDSSMSTVFLSILWLLYAVVHLVYGIEVRHVPTRLFALVLFALVIAKSFLIDVWMLDILSRILCFFGLACLAFFGSYMYNKV